MTTPSLWCVSSRNVIAAHRGVHVTSRIGKDFLQQHLGMSQPSLVNIKRGILLGLTRRCTFMYRNGTRTTIRRHEFLLLLLLLCPRFHMIVPIVPNPHPQKVHHHLDILLPTPTLNVIMPHILHVVRHRSKLGRDRRQQPRRVPERHHLVLTPVDDQRGTPHIPRAFFVVEKVAHHSQIESVEVGNDLVHR